MLVLEAIKSCLPKSFKQCRLLTCQSCKYAIFDGWGETVESPKSTDAYVICLRSRLTGSCLSEAFPRVAQKVNADVSIGVDSERLRISAGVRCSPHVWAIKDVNIYNVIRREGFCAVWISPVFRLHWSVSHSGSLPISTLVSVN